ncbi:MAG TPA: iron ABC transporter permease [Nitrospira sp.]|nr:iron ABC transporter permease [Nitrospira sp.]
MTSSVERARASADMLDLPKDPARLPDPVDHGMFEASSLTVSRWMAIIGMLAGCTVFSAVICLQFGAEYIRLNDILRILVGSIGDSVTDAETTATILFHVRVPRIVLGFLAGCSLASVGVALQALLRNPLADPYVLGVSSGAALGVSIAVLFGVGTTILTMSALPLCGFLGGLAALAIVYRMAVSSERLPVHSVLLAGVILNAVFSALIMFITSIMDPNRSFGMMAWLMGSLTAPAYPALIVLAIYVFACFGLLLRHARALNIMTSGDEPARSLGLDTERTKRYTLLLSALLTGAVVSYSGMIGFIGMVIPHAVRLGVGADHRLLMPAAALVGGAFLMVSDTVARTVLSPSELPVGILTALVGGPFFVYLLAWRKDRMS